MKGKDCVQDCGDDFIDNRTCVSSCPDYFEYVREEIVSVDHSFYKLKFCEKECPKGNFLHGNYCVDACPQNAFFLINNTCVKTCPETHPFKRNVTIDKIPVALQCHLRCPDSTFANNTSCIEFCPRIYNRTCVDSCPVSAPLTHNSKLGVIYQNTSLRIFRSADFCVEQCPKGLYTRNTTCVDFCPLVNDTTCVDVCPITTPFICDSHKIWSCPYTYWKTRTSICTNSCPQKSFLKNNTCVDFCPLIHNKTCVDSCPTTAPYMCDPYKEEELCKMSYGYSKKKPNFCVEACPEHTHAVENACISACPNEMMYFNNTCIKTCPINYTAVTSFRKGRWGSTYTFKTCVANCSATLYLNGIYQNGIYLNGNNCVDHCPNYVIMDETLCVDECPASHPYIRNYYPRQCVSSCEKDEIAVNGSCRYKHPNDNKQCPHKIGDICITIFNEASLWIFEGCHTKISIVRRFLLFLLLSLLWIMLLLLMFTNVWETWCRKYFKKKKVRGQYTTI